MVLVSQLITGQAAGAQPAAPPPAPNGKSTGKAQRQPDFPVGEPTASDVAVSGWGDPAGYHLQVATAKGGFAWREVALLHPAGIDDAGWLGYQCVSGDGRFAAVTVLPASGANHAEARDHGAVAYSVDLASGVVRPLVAGVGLKYHSPGCGTGTVAALTANPGTDEASTVVVTVDLAAGTVAGRTTVAGQLTSVVPAESGVVGAMGRRLVRVAAQGGGTPATLVTADGAPYEVRAAADGGVDYLTLAAGAGTATAWHEHAGRPGKLASGPKERLQLFQGRAGRSVLAGATSVVSGGGVVVVDDRPLAHGASAASLGGSALLGADADPGRADPVLVATGTHRLVSRPRAKSAATGTGVLPATTAAGAKVKAAAQTPTCGVPRLDATRQALQPNAARVNWAVQMAEQNLLTGSLGRPAGYANMGLAAYAANSDFPKIGLQHPAGDSWDSVPRSVMEAVLAQESNWSQASWHALPGIAGDPLIASYYGVVDSIDTIDYANADCGYGIAQVTSGMAVADPSISPNGKAKVAVDYEENIAAGLQILEEKWNQLYSAGVIANDGNPRYLENWYFAVWAYNTGVQPTARFGNTTGCTPSPTCTGPDGTWGLGWSNNPRNPDYPPGRPAYLQNSYGDAAHPSQWPYQERIMGWMGRPLIRQGADAYARPTYHGSTWLRIPGISTFCTADNRCDPNDPAGQYCTLSDFECWWHTPAGWANCPQMCATSSYTVGAGSSEPALADPHPPTCSLDTAKVPNAGNGPPIIVDDQPSPVDLVGCGGSNWSTNGTFSYTYGHDGDGNPTGAIDTHQLGAGFGGHILFTHTESSADPRVVNTGRWTPNLPKLQYYKLKLHFPATGASATNVVYKIYPGGGVSPWQIRVNQHWESEQWVTIGTFAMQNGGYVELSNTSADTASGNVDYSDYDVAYDAVAFVQMGGTPGRPIGGPPQILDAPRGSNPAWIQCGCVRRTAGDPVDTSTGFYGETYTDLATPGRGKPLVFTRSYASALADPAGPAGAAAVNGPFGYGWTFSYNLSAVTDPATGNVAIKQEDGSQVPFVNTSGSYAPAAPRFDATLAKTGSTYTYTRRSQDLYTFDVATGRLLSETDLPGFRASPQYATTLAYDPAGHLSTITDPAHRAYTLTWTGSHITGVQDSAGRQVTYGYDTAGNLTDVYGVGTTRTPAVKDDDHTVFGYTTAHLLNSVRRPTAYGSTATPTPVVSMAYDTAERVTSQTDQLGHTTTFTYGPDAGAGLAAGQTLVTDPAGHKTINTYTNGLLTAETRGAGTPDAGTWTYTYDPASLGVTTISDPDGHLQTFTYDDHGNQISSSDARGYTTSRVYDDHNRLVTTIDPTGAATFYGYDEAGHIATSTGSNDGSAVYSLPTSITLKRLGQSAEVPDGNPSSPTVRATSFYYDDAAHPADPIRVVNARGYTTTNAYDAYGDLTSTKDAENNTTRYGYDTGRGLRTTTVSPVGVAVGVTPDCKPPAKGCTTFAYDAWNHLVTTTDPLGHTMTAGYDADGNQTSETDANNRTTIYSYDFADRRTLTKRADNTTLRTDYHPDGTIADTVDGANQTTTYVYDAQGRRTTRTDPAQRTTVWKYDPAGRLLSVTDAAGRATSYGYDADNHQTSITYSDRATPNVTAATYDAMGRPTSATDGTGTSTWSYNAFGEVSSFTNGAGATVGYDHDAAGNTTTITYPGASGHTVTRTFDKDDRLSTVSDWNNATTVFGYDPDGSLIKITYPNGTVATRTFDDADQLTTTTVKAGTTALATITSPRDNAGQIGGETPTGVPGTGQTFGYTPLEQLKSVTAGGTTTSYAYDAADNPITLGATTQAFDAASQLCWSTTNTPPSPSCASPPAGATTYGYDGVGNRATTTAGSAATTYSYDQSSRLTRLTKPGTTATYTYDGGGLRASKTVNGATTDYIWSSTGDLLSDGTTSYVYGPADLPVEQIGTAGTQWFLQDHLGSTRALVDSSGAIVGGYTYTAWGAVTSHTGTASTPLQFAGQYTDAESGLIYLRARYYDPATAQFLTVDPLLDATHSRYGYVDGNPLNGTDPTGLCGWFCKVAVGVGIGVVVGATIACVIAEPCGLIEGGIAVGVGGGLALGGGITLSGGAGTVIAGGAATGAVGGAIWSITSSHGDSSSGGSGTSSRDVHGRLADPDVDVEKVCTDGDMYIQDDGQIVRVLDNGNGTSDVVVRDPANPTGEPTTKIKDMPNRQVESRIRSGRWS